MINPSNTIKMKNFRITLLTAMLILGGVLSWAGKVDKAVNKYYGYLKL